MRLSSRALMSATALASALSLGVLGVAPSYAATGLSISQNAPAAAVQLGHKFTVSVDVTNNTSPAVSSITASDTLPAGLTFWSIKINPPFDQLTTCTTPKKNQSGTISCTVTALAGQTLPAGTFTGIATVTLKARKAGAWTNTASISAPGVDATTNSVTINVKTGNGHPKTPPQNKGQNKGQDNGQQNGQGKTDNNGHPNPGKAKGHSK